MDDGCYPTEGKSLLLLFNLQNYLPGHLTRLGSSEDAEGIKEVFSERNFDVCQFEDLTTEEIRGKLRAVGDYGNNYRCIIFIFLAHGYQGGIYGVSGRELSFHEIQTCLSAENCPAIKNLPKILIFESCRLKQGLSNFAINAEDHFLIAFSTGKGLKSYRDPQSGTFYIKTLLSTIRDMGDEEDLESILRAVKRKLPQEYPDYNQKPEYYPFLTDKVYVKKIKSTGISPAHSTNNISVMETTSPQQKQSCVISTPHSIFRHKNYVPGVENNQGMKHIQKHTATLPSSNCSAPLQNIINHPNTSHSMYEHYKGGKFPPLESPSKCSTPSPSSSTNLEATSLTHPLQPVTSSESEREVESTVEDSLLSNNSNRGNHHESGVKPQGGRTKLDADAEKSDEQKTIANNMNNSERQCVSRIMKNVTQNEVDEDFIDITCEFSDVHVQSTQFMEEWQEIVMPSKGVQ